MKIIEWFKRLWSGMGQKADTFWTREDVYFGGTLPRSSYNYGHDLRGGLDSNVVMAPVNWIQRVFSEAEPIVEAKTDGRWRPIDGHKLEQRLQNPNDFYDGDTLLKATILSYTLDGNAYWIKIRNAFGEVLEYWYVPHWQIAPAWPGHGKTYISHYSYQPEGTEHKNLLPRDVVHFRFGLDPRNTRKGFSPLRPLLREVFTDEEAANFTAALLRNMGVPGLIVSPTKDSPGLTPEKAQLYKERLLQHFTRDKRGEPFVATTPTDVKQFGFDPQTLMLGNLRDIAEERACSMLGIPAAVVGFGAGLQQTKVGATMRELVRLARVQCINPMARTFAKQLHKQTMSDYQSQAGRYRIRFDMSEVSVFAEDETEWEARVLKRVEGGVMRVDHAQSLLGLEVDESQRVYLRNSQFQAVEADKDPTVIPDASGNGRQPANRLEGITED